MTLTAQQIAQLCRASLHGNMEYAHVPLEAPLTDSRSLTDSARTAFFALRTETGNGALFVKPLYARGVRVFVVDNRNVHHVPSGALAAVVPDVLDALHTVAAHLRQTLRAHVVAVTGSVAKSVVKETIAHFLRPSMEVSTTPRSHNSQIGVPLSVWQSSSSAQVTVYEAGVSHSGEMERLGRILRPDTGVFTLLTDEHSRGFESEAEKCRQKCLLFQSCSTIFYVSNPVVEGVLRTMYPDRRLVACPNLATLVQSCLKHLGGSDVSLSEIEAYLHRIGPRIELAETYTNSIVAFDHCSCTPESIETALDFMHRNGAQSRPVTMFLGRLEGRGDGLRTLMQRYNVAQVYVIGADVPASLPGAIAVSSVDEVQRQLSVADFYGSAVYINGGGDDNFSQLFAWFNTHRNITRLEINLDSLAHNYNHYRSLLPATTGIIGMVKASGYGCGAVEVARTLQSRGADAIAVAVVDEGVALRNAGVTLPVIVLDPWCENLRAIFAYNLEPTIIEPSESMMQMLETAAAQQGIDTVRVHLKLDTGMHRVGLMENEIDRFMELSSRHPRIQIATVFSHLATADCTDMDMYTQQQLDTFQRMSQRIIAQLPYPVKRHILNTAGISRYGRTQAYDMARLGIGLYGLSPLDADDAAALKPVARLVTRIIALRTCQPGDAVGYGRRGAVSRPTLIATLPVGYADGLDRRLGNGNASFLVNGKLCPTVGNICMDLCMIDVTECGPCAGAEVTLFGPELSIERISSVLGTISYEVLASISPRVKRVYYRE